MRERVKEKCIFIEQNELICQTTLQFHKRRILLPDETLQLFTLNPLFCKARDNAFQVTQWLKNSPASARDTGDSGSVPGPERSSGGGKDNPHQYSYLKKSMDRRLWQATYSPWGHKE